MSMVPHLWLPLDTMEVAKQFNLRHAPAMTLPESFQQAVWAAEGSQYLEKLDAATHPGNGAPVMPTGIPGDLVDISHVRWATANAITAIDLCAATMGRVFCGITGPPELSLRDFDLRANRRGRETASWCTLSGVVKRLRGQTPSNPPSDARSLRAKLPTPFEDWVKDTLRDPLYKQLHGARNPLTHSWLTRIPHRGGQAPANRTQFEVRGSRRQGPTRRYARELVEDSARLAIGRVNAFAEVVNQH